MKSISFILCSSVFKYITWSFVGTQLNAWKLYMACFPFTLEIAARVCQCVCAKNFNNLLSLASLSILFFPFLHLVLLSYSSFPTSFLLPPVQICVYCEYPTSKTSPCMPLSLSSPSSFFVLECIKPIFSDKLLYVGKMTWSYIVREYRKLGADTQINKQVAQLLQTVILIWRFHLIFDDSEDTRFCLKFCFFLFRLYSTKVHRHA